MPLLKAERIEDRFGETALRCPLCGHIFYSSKQYTKHLYKSHLTKIPKRFRARKKLEKAIEKVRSKKSNKKPLTLWEKIVDIKAKLLGHK